MAAILVALDFANLCFYSEPSFTYVPRPFILGIDLLGHMHLPFARATPTRTCTRRWAPEQNTVESDSLSKHGADQSWD